MSGLAGQKDAETVLLAGALAAGVQQYEQSGDGRPLWEAVNALRERALSGQRDTPMRRAYVDLLTQIPWLNQGQPPR